MNMPVIEPNRLRLANQKAFFGRAKDIGASMVSGGIGKKMASMKLSKVRK